MNKFLKSFLFALTAALCVLGAVSADYYYRVPSEEVIYWIESDGSVSVSYDYSVENTNSGDTIEYVDIGTPSNNFSLNDVEVYVNDTKITDGIKVSYANYSESGLYYGVTLDMGSYSIRAGESAKVYVLIKGLQGTLYEATSETINEVETAFVGFDFAPNYFGSKYVEGKTDYTFQLVFPKGVTSETSYYYKPENWPGADEPEAWIEDELVVYQWHAAEASAAKQYIFGGKFPSNVLTSTANINNEAEAVVSSGSSESSGSSSFKETLEEILSCLACLVPFGGLGFIIYKISEKKKVKASKHYFPPQIKTDGEGIKRGLTAVEAAVLLEIDIDRVISMIIFGLAKKGVITIKSQDPFEVEITDPLPDGLYEYETNFIEALRETNENKRTLKLRQAINRLILSTSKRLEGFSLKDTKEYYKSICDKAWEQVEAADTDELKSQLLGEHFGWAMLAEEPEKKVETVFRGGTLYEPSWWWRYDPSYHRPAPMRPSRPDPMPNTSGTFSDSHTETSTSSDSDSGGGTSAMPVLPGAMFARSITDSARSLGTKLTGNTQEFQSKVRNATNPVAPSSPSSRHRGGGGGSSCACACACDSCACACAGGGR